MKRIKMILEGDVDYRKSSSLQGVMFEHVSMDYAERMHEQQLHPYSQCLIKEDGKNIWQISAFDPTAEHEIIDLLLDEGFSEFTFHKSEEKVRILEKQVEECEHKALLEEFYTQKAGRKFVIEFLTATAFRRQGRYVIMPDIRLIIQSLMNKYSAALPQMNMYDEDTLEQLTESIEIAGYRLRTVLFPLEGVTVPGFIGEITLRVHGSDTMARYLRMLLRFGEYSGVGVKTGMGMGAIRVEERRSGRDRAED